jgi:predicted nucleic acid-binding protein
MTKYKGIYNFNSQNITLYTMAKNKDIAHKNIIMQLVELLHYSRSFIKCYYFNHDYFIKEV